MHACVVGAGGGVGGVSATHIRHHRLLLRPMESLCNKVQGVNEICRALDGAPVCITVTSLDFRPGSTPSDLATRGMWQ